MEMQNGSELWMEEGEYRAVASGHGKMINRNRPWSEKPQPSNPTLFK
jgi:hypothetical protein